MKPYTPTHPKEGRGHPRTAPCQSWTFFSSLYIFCLCIESKGSLECAQFSQAEWWKWNNFSRYQGHYKNRGRLPINWAACWWCGPLVWSLSEYVAKWQSYHRERERPAGTFRTRNMTGLVYSISIRLIISFQRSPHIREYSNSTCAGSALHWVETGGGGELAQVLSQQWSL